MTLFTKVEQKRLPEVVADKIEEAIFQRSFNVGAQLPSEQQLADQFGVSRNVIREAFKFLKERGLIIIQNGSGAYVAEPSSAHTRNALGRYLRMLGTHEAISDLFEARRLLEGENARLAAERATEADFVALEACLQRMREHAGSMEKWASADLDFHLAIARATQNSFFTVLLEPLVGQLHDVIAEGYTVPGATAYGLQAHIEIFRAIKEHDAEHAQQAILAHLRDSEFRVGNHGSV